MIKLNEKQKKIIKISTAIVGVAGVGALIYIAQKYRINLQQYKDLLNKADKRIENLTALCHEKDKYFEEVISDGLRHGSPLAAKHMADRNWYLKSLYAA